jgi:hypothetical protein
MHAAYWYLGYYLFGLCLAVPLFLLSERKPGESLPLISRLGAQAAVISQTALLWPLVVLGYVIDAYRKRRAEANSHESPAALAEAFRPDAEGVIHLVTVSKGVMVPIAVFFIVLPLVIVVTCWLQERRLSGLFLFSLVIFAVCFFVASFGFRQTWCERLGLRVERGELVWTEAAGWSPRNFRLPLQDVAAVQQIETDPMFFENGLALILKENASCSGNLDSRLDALNRDQVISPEYNIDPAIPLDRIVIWPHDKWDWEAEVIAAWLTQQQLTTGVK